MLLLHVAAAAAKPAKSCTQESRSSIHQNSSALCPETAETWHQEIQQRGLDVSGLFVPSLPMQSVCDSAIQSVNCLCAIICIPAQIMKLLVIYVRLTSYA